MTAAESLLVVEYTAERANVLNAAKPADYCVGACRYCGRWWRPVFGTRLDGHAKCLVSDEWKRWLWSYANEHRLTERAIADALDVSIGTVRAWISPRVTVWHGEVRR